MSRGSASALTFFDGLQLPKAARSPTVVIQPRKSLFDLDLKAVWEYRDLLYFLVWRDVKVRYKQTAIGAAWAIVQPLLTMVIFTVVFGHFAKIPSEGTPYYIFAFTALVPWTYFSQAITASGVSLVGDAKLIQKVYFPRLIVPIAAGAGPLVDFAIAFLVLVGMIAHAGIAPTWGMMFLPVFLLLEVGTVFAVGLWLSALNVRYRDVRHTIPFLMQLWMYASPVAYPLSLVPEQWRLLYSLNPIVGVLEGFRWALLGTEQPHVGVMLVSAVVVTTVLLSGVVYFRRMERTFADVV